MADPDTFRQLGDAAQDAARGPQGTLIGVVGAVLGSAMTTVVQRVRGETIVEAIRKGNESLRQTMVEEGAATRKAIHETGARTQEKLQSMSESMAILGERINHMDRTR